MKIKWLKLFLCIYFHFQNSFFPLIQMQPNTKLSFQVVRFCLLKLNKTHFFYVKICETIYYCKTDAINSRLHQLTSWLLLDVMSFLPSFLMALNKGQTNISLFFHFDVLMCVPYRLKRVYICPLVAQNALRRR